FDPNEKIIENVIRIKDDLSSLSLNDFIDELSRNSFAPGGGSVSALSGSLGAALISMVANLTHDKKNFFHLRKKMNEVGSEAQSLIKQLLLLVDEDTKAYNKVVEINRLPASTEKELKNKKVLIREANEYAINVPLKVISLSLQVLELGKYLVINGNPNSVSDVGVGAEVALAASRGAAMNVLINLKDIEDSKDQKVKEKKVLELTNKAESIHQFIHDKTLKIIAK
ncbi:MAG: cyclodeaminase/cyclohydrolase family protein, partial [Candidatus Neomarinimicrobiota bacterium]|nr:cyclodeaminase/cyclohydrolase family protein [Candidatus Neomarinimicrobiota bacterium]